MEESLNELKQQAARAQTTHERLLAEARQLAVVTATDARLAARKLRVYRPGVATVRAIDLATLDREVLQAKPKASLFRRRPTAEAAALLEVQEAAGERVRTASPFCYPLPGEHVDQTSQEIRSFVLVDAYGSGAVVKLVANIPHLPELPGPEPLRFTTLTVTEPPRPEATEAELREYIEQLRAVRRGVAKLLVDYGLGD